jgi:hypothetical protein
MNRLLLALVAALAFSPAWAADNTIILTPGVGVTERSVDIGAGVQAPGVVVVGSTGVAIYGTAGTANANVLTVQGVASMTPLLATGTGTAGSAASGVLSVQGIASMTPVFTSADPCTQATKLGAVISVTGSAQIIAGTSAKKTYICAIDVVTATAQNIALVEGTGSVCATNIFGLAGGTGWNFAANSGVARGSGDGTVYSPSADTNAAAANVCLLLSGSGQTSGQISYVQQ